MDRLTPPRRNTSQRIPHARGDGPSARSSARTCAAYSPRTWGWTAVSARRCWRNRVFPTHVGMDRTVACGAVGIVRIPHARGDGPSRPHSGGSCPTYSHARGDGPQTRTGALMDSEYSPRTWGWTDSRIDEAEVAMVFPTHVGMDRSRWPVSQTPRRIPHARGDGPPLPPDSPPIPMYSPRTWGWTVRRNHGHDCHSCVFPTHVGMDRK